MQPACATAQAVSRQVPQVRQHRAIRAPCKPPSRPEAEHRHSRHSGCNATARRCRRRRHPASPNRRVKLGEIQLHRRSCSCAHRYGSPPRAVACGDRSRPGRGHDLHAADRAPLGETMSRTSPPLSARITRRIISTARPERIAASGGVHSTACGRWQSLGRMWQSESALAAAGAVTVIGAEREARAGHHFTAHDCVHNGKARPTIGAGC